MSPIYDCSVDSELLTGMRLARAAIGRGELVVIPTDTVYGVAADAFSPEAVQRLLDAKGRGRQSPPPVLIPGLATLDALAERVPDKVRELVARFWPGGLTVVLPASPSLAWDLGETHGTVALRMPSDRFALALLEETGPLAVSSANRTGLPAAKTAAEAEGMLGDSVAVYLEADAGGELASTIVDATAYAADAGPIRILRDGAISEAELREVLGDALEGASGETVTAASGDAAVDDAAATATATAVTVPDDGAPEARDETAGEPGTAATEGDAPGEAGSSGA